MPHIPTPWFVLCSTITARDVLRSPTIDCVTVLHLDTSVIGKRAELVIVPISITMYYSDGEVSFNTNMVSPMASGEDAYASTVKASRVPTGIFEPVSSGYYTQTQGMSGGADWPSPRRQGFIVQTAVYAKSSPVGI